MVLSLNSRIESNKEEEKKKTRSIWLKKSGASDDGGMNITFPTCSIVHSVCRAQGAGCRVQGTGFRVQGAGCRVEG